MISNTRLVIGGITYPAAPYNGVYICQAIGEDVLADDGRTGWCGTSPRGSGWTCRRSGRCGGTGRSWS